MMINTLNLTKFLSLYCLKCMRLVCSPGFKLSIIAYFSKGMKRKDGFQGMGNQNHLLDCRKGKTLRIGRGLWKEVDMVMQLLLKIPSRKGRKPNHQMQFQLRELVFLLLPKDLSMYYSFSPCYCSVVCESSFSVVILPLTLHYIWYGSCFLHSFAISVMSYYYFLSKRESDIRGGNA